MLEKRRDNRLEDVMRRWLGINSIFEKIFGGCWDNFFAAASLRFSDGAYPQMSRIEHSLRKPDTHKEPVG